MEPNPEPRPLPPSQSLLYGAGSIGAGMVFAFTNAALPFYLASYGLPNVLIGLLGQDRPPTAGVLQIAVGALSDRTRTRLGRRRPFILLGIPVAALGLLGLAARPPLPLMLLLLLVMTSFLAIGYGPYLALLVDLVPAEQRGRVGSVLAAGNMLGQLGLLFLASQLWATQESVVFGTLVGGLLIGFGLVCSGVREPVLPAAAPSPLRWRPRAYLRNLARHREVVKYLLATLVFWFGTGSVIPFLTRFGVNELGANEGTAIQLLMIAVLATTVATLPAGWLGDRFGKKRVLTIGLALFGLSILVSSQVRSVEQAVAGLALTGLANGVCTALLLPLLGDLIPKQRAGEFVGLGSAVWELAQPLGAVLGGMSADLTGTLRSSLFVAGLVVLASCLLLSRVDATPVENSPPP